MRSPRISTLIFIYVSLFSSFLTSGCAKDDETDKIPVNESKWIYSKTIPEVFGRDLITGSLVFYVIFETDEYAHHRIWTKAGEPGVDENGKMYHSDSEYHGENVPENFRIPGSLQKQISTLLRSDDYTYVVVSLFSDGGPTLIEWKIEDY